MDFCFWAREHGLSIPPQAWEAWLRRSTEDASPTFAPYPGNIAINGSLDELWDVYLPIGQRWKRTNALRLSTLLPPAQQGRLYTSLAGLGLISLAVYWVDQPSQVRVVLPPGTAILGCRDLSPAVFTESVLESARALAAAA